MLTQRLLHIAFCFILLPLALGACTEEDAAPAGESRTLTVDLNIAITRADGTDADDESTPTDLRLWMFNPNRNNELVAYEHIPNPAFSRTDIENKWVTTVHCPIEVEGALTDLDVYAVLNDPAGLDKFSDPATIQQATFTRPDNGWAGDNRVPITGKETVDITQTHSINLTATRAVSKLELFFTKKDKEGYLMVTDLKMEQLPDKSYLFPQETPEITYFGVKERFLPEAVEIEKFFSDDAGLGSFSEHEENFTPVSTTYWLENPNGGQWTEQQPDDIYPDEIEDETTRYKLTVTYQTTREGPAKPQTVYLPAMERNMWTKIYVRVGSEWEMPELNYKVVPWNKEEIIVPPFT